jgi:hypothetical protein
MLAFAGIAIAGLPPLSATASTASVTASRLAS